MTTTISDTITITNQVTTTTQTSTTIPETFTNTSTETQSVTTTTPTTSTSAATFTSLKSSTTTIATTTETTRTETQGSSVYPVWEIILYLIGFGGGEGDFGLFIAVGMIVVVAAISVTWMFARKRNDDDND